MYFPKFWNILHVILSFYFSSCYCKEIQFIQWQITGSARGCSGRCNRNNRLKKIRAVVQKHLSLISHFLSKYVIVLFCRSMSLPLVEVCLFYLFFWWVESYTTFIPKFLPVPVLWLWLELGKYMVENSFKMRHEETDSPVFNMLNDKCWHHLMSTSGISFILSRAVWLTLTKSMESNSQSEPLEFSGKWKFLASIIGWFSPSCLCRSPVLGQALCWVLTKMSKTKTVFLPLK